MALFLGKKIGRPVLRFISRNHEISNKLDIAGKAIHRIIPSFTPGKTRAVFELYERCAHNDRINIGPDGFYKHNEKISGNKYIADYFKKMDVSEFTFDSRVSPEEFLGQSRMPVVKKIVFLNAWWTLMALSMTAFLYSPRRGNNGLIPSFISDHIGSMPIVLMFLPKGIINILLIWLSINARTKKVIDYLFWGATSIILTLSETIGFEGFGTPDPLDLPVPLYGLFSLFMLDRYAFERFKNDIFKSFSKNQD